MKAPARPWQRLTLAAAAAVGALLVLSWLAAQALPSRWQETVGTSLGYLTPISYAITAACMAIGGAIGGRRFVAVSLVLTLLVWAGTFAVLINIAVPLAQAGAPHPLPQLLRTNLLGVLLSLLAAGLGAHAGARWQARRIARTHAAA